MIIFGKDDSLLAKNKSAGITINLSFTQFRAFSWSHFAKLLPYMDVHSILDIKMSYGHEQLS